MTGKEGNLCFCTKQIPKSCFLAPWRRIERPTYPLGGGRSIP